jgi:outer membrane protein insertion porin family
MNFIRPEMTSFRSYILLAFILLSLSLSASSQSFNVVDIKVEGNKTSSANLILSSAGISKGDQLTSATTQEVVRRLYGLGFFKDVTIDAEEVTGGISLVIRVVELPKLAGFEYSGNKKIKTKDLNEKLKLTAGSYLSPNLIFQKKAEILELYSNKGYFMAGVEPEMIYSADSSQINLIYKINEGSKVKVEKVILTGNEKVKADDIIGKMRNRKRGFLKSSDFDIEKFPEDKDKIIESLHKKGHIDAYLKSDSFTVDTSRNRMTIYLDIYEGPRYYFGKTEWKGNEIYKSETLAKVIKYKEGQVFDLEKFEESTYEIYFLYQEKGHLHIRVTDDRKTRDSLIDVTFDIVEGLPSKVNLVKITGNTKTKEKVIRREISIKPGQVFNRSLLIRSVRDIMQLNYFGNVTPDLANLPSGDVDILVKVEEKPTGQISAGAGYSGQDKFVGTFGIGIPNFRGMGQNLNFSVDIGSTRNSYSLSFTEPWMFSTPTSMGADIYFTNRRWYDDYTEGRRGGSLRLGRRLKWPDNYFKMYGRYRFEGDRFYEFSDYYEQTHSELLGKQRDYYSKWTNNENKLDTVVTYIYGDPMEGTLLSYKEKWNNSSSIQLAIERDSRNLPEFATSGSSLSYSVDFTGNWLGGYWEYQKHNIEVAKFIPLFWKVALAGKLNFAFINAPAGDNKILEFDRFSPGGTSYEGIVRGYDDGSLTPDTLAQSNEIITIYNNYYTQIDTFPAHLDSARTLDTTYSSNNYATVRGKYMLVGNLELQIPIIENQFYSLLFFDVGNSWLNRKSIKLNDLYKGVGFGFRLIVPGIGTIGFDFGYPLDDRLGQKKSLHPHFQIGTTFR